MHPFKTYPLFIFRYRCIITRKRPGEHSNEVTGRTHSQTNASYELFEDRIALKLTSDSKTNSKCNQQVGGTSVKKRNKEEIGGRENEAHLYEYAFQKENDCTD